MDLICGECGAIDCLEHRDSVSTIVWEDCNVRLGGNMLHIGEDELVLRVSRFEQVNHNPGFGSIVEVECVSLCKKKLLLVRVDSKTIFVLEDYDMEGIL